MNPIAAIGISIATTIMEAWKHGRTLSTFATLRIPAPKSSLQAALTVGGCGVLEISAIALRLAQRNSSSRWGRLCLIDPYQRQH